MTTQQYIPRELLESTELAKTSSEAVLFYSLLRHQVINQTTATSKLGLINGKLTANVDFTEMASKLGIHINVVGRCVDELVKRTWITNTTEKGVYLLGIATKEENTFFLESKILPKGTKSGSLAKPSDLIRAKLKEDSDKRKNGRLVKDIREKLAGDAFRGVQRPALKAADVLIRFNALYLKKYGMKPPLVTVESGRADARGMTLIYINRAIKWSTGVKQVISVIEYIFENWEAVRDGLGLDGPPSFNIIGSSKLWPRLVCCMTEGIPKKRGAKGTGESVAKRYDDKKVRRDIGW